MKRSLKAFGIAFLVFAAIAVSTSVLLIVARTFGLAAAYVPLGAIMFLSLYSTVLRDIK
jgi:hypothetical protein